MRRGLVVLVVVATAALTVVLRETTMSRHRTTTPGTVSELVVRVRSNEPRLDLTAAAGALLAACRLEVTADPLGPPEEVADATFVLRLAPELDDTDRRQLHGCIEDAALDHVQAEVLHSRHSTDAAPPG